MNDNPTPVNVRLSEDEQSVVIIDQTLLPGEERFLSLGSPEECYDAIARLAVRGAPAIGIFAAYSVYVMARRIILEEGRNVFENHQFDSICVQADYLKSSRPTAVNLKWAIDRMTRVAAGLIGLSSGDVLNKLRDEAVLIQKEDVDQCLSMAELGLTLIEDGDGIITHCNAGPLATSCYGTAIGPVLLGTERGMEFKVFADETRPLLQGARLTSYELHNAGVDVTLICDSMSSSVMSQGWVKACFVGADRVAANGDTANKIGTSSLAIVAKHYGIPFYVMCPTSTLDFDCSTGEDIPIELRDGQEIKTMFFQHPVAPAEVECYNPSFDVTDHSLITAIVTEKGICRPPFEKSLASLNMRFGHGDAGN